MAIGLGAIISMVGAMSSMFTFAMTLMFKKLWARRWNIPTIIMMYSGDKRRPTFKITSARQEYTLGRNRLWVKGYRLPIRDFKRENYWPVGKKGGLILWEFKKGWLTPVLPKGKKLSKKEKAYLDNVGKQINSMNIVDFEFDSELYHNLILKAIDDIDVEWFLRQQDRIEQQYTGGWRDFLSKYGGHVLITIIAILMFTGFVLWMKDAPSQSGACIQAGVEAAKATYLSEIASTVTTVPPG